MKTDPSVRPKSQFVGSICHRRRWQAGAPSLDNGKLRFYTIQAAISATHAQAARFEDTDWTQIIVLYSKLMESDPSPVIKLNQVVALAMREH
jgi:RNA polymerase sigma-70 factor (ECF subfamily)